MEQHPGCFKLGQPGNDVIDMVQYIHHQKMTTRWRYCPLYVSVVRHVLPATEDPPVHCSQYFWDPEVLTQKLGVGAFTTLGAYNLAEGTQNIAWCHWRVELTGG